MVFVMGLYCISFQKLNLLDHYLCLKNSQQISIGVFYYPVLLIYIVISSLFGSNDRIRNLALLKKGYIELCMNILRQMLIVCVYTMHIPWEDRMAVEYENTSLAFPDTTTFYFSTFATSSISCGRTLLWFCWIHVVRRVVHITPGYSDSPLDFQFPDSWIWLMRNKSQSLETTRGYCCLTINILEQ